MREHARDRGRRLLGEGRLVICLVDERQVLATCRGDSGEVHELGFRDDAGWFCTCPARSRCGHLFALQLVTVAPGGALDFRADSIGGAA